MRVHPAAEALGRGYVMSKEGGAEWHRVPVSRGEDGTWTRSHPTDPKGANIKLRSERVYAWTKKELAEKTERAEAWGREVAELEADRKVI